MKIDRKRMLSGGAEFLVVLPLVLFLLSKTIFYLKNSLKANPQWLDIWHQCYILQLQITRLFFLNPGRIWDGGTCYPFNSSSLLFDEPSWGISFFTAPAWFLTKNIFVIFRAGAAAALVLAWLGTYYFFKSLGARRLWAFCAGGMFCLSGICLLLVICVTASRTS